MCARTLHPHTNTTRLLPSDLSSNVIPFDEDEEDEEEPYDDVVALAGRRQDEEEEDSIYEVLPPGVWLHANTHTHTLPPALKDSCELWPGVSLPQQRWL